MSEENLLTKIKSLATRITDLETQEKSTILQIRTIALSETLTKQDRILLVNTSIGSVTLTLPSAANKIELVIKKTVAANTLTIQRGGTDTIEGATSIALTAVYSSRTLIGGGGTVWYIKSSI